MKIIIIGGGPGGYETAIEASKNGIDVILITEGRLGGTCLNEGCIPTKTFTSSKSLEEAKISTGEVIGQLSNGIEYLLKRYHITLVYGHASFVNSKSVVVNGVLYTADNIIIATGSLPIELTFSELNGYNVKNSSEILNIDTVPKSLAIIGGGVIGLEFASIFHKFGSKVTIYEYTEQILPRFDKELSSNLKRSLIKQGISIQTSYRLGDIDDLEADVVLVAVGRKPNIDGLGLENIGVEYTERGIIVDENMETSVKGVYAIGDVNGKIMLAHVATFQGRRALHHLLGETDRIRFDLVPSTVFTIPEVATVGLTEEQCEDDEIDYQCLKSYYRANGKAVSMRETEGFCKIILDNETKKILGAHIIGTHASDLIHELTVLMNMNATFDDARNIIHAHPSLSEIIQNAFNN
jgi:dihydrolipoamide dehydrogenase